MSEAEDVVLEAAERAARATRDLWRRHQGNAAAEAERRAAARRRIALFVHAATGRAWPVAAAAAPPRPSWLRRRALPPWARVPRPLAFFDGARICVPDTEPGDPSATLAALGLAAQLARGTATRLPADPLARDLAWIAGAEAAERWIAGIFPGLVGDLFRARREALAVRPAPDALTAAERRVEARVRAALGAAPDWRADAEAPRRGGRARYRGFAPVAHWGVPRPDLARPAPVPPGARRAPSVGNVPAAALPRRPEERRETPQEAPEGPFVLPAADPHLAAEDARVARPADRGPEDPEALADALAELPAATLVDAEDPVAEVLERRGSAPRDVRAQPEPPPDTFAYPEWDHRRSAYRPRACRVRERPAPEGDPAWAERILRARASQLAALRRRFEALRPRRERLGRQPDGDEMDLDAWVDAFAERRAGRGGGERLYRVDRPRRREVAVALLLDASASTDAWVAGEQRVIDVEKEAALCFAEALDALGDPHALYAFSGHGAADVRVQVLAPFAKRSETAVRRRIGGLAPDGMTRLGGALRHVGAALARQPAAVRLLLLLSDGRPDDEDAYGGDYGLEDVRQAVAELRAVGTEVFAVTVDRNASTYLPHLFGARGYTVVTSLPELPERLPELYRRLAVARG